MGSKTGLYAVKEPQLKRIKGNIYDNQKNPQCGRIYDESGISPTVAGWRSDARGFIAVTKDHNKLRKTKDESLAIDVSERKYFLSTVFSRISDNEDTFPVLRNKVFRVKHLPRNIVPKLIQRCDDSGKGSSFVVIK